MYPLVGVFKYTHIQGLKDTNIHIQGFEDTKTHIQGFGDFNTYQRLMWYKHTYSRLGDTYYKNTYIQCLRERNADIKCFGDTYIIYIYKHIQCFGGNKYLHIQGLGDTGTHMQGLGATETYIQGLMDKNTNKQGMGDRNTRTNGSGIQTHISKA